MRFEKLLNHGMFVGNWIRGTVLPPYTIDACIFREEIQLVRGQPSPRFIATISADAILTAATTSSRAAGFGAGLTISTTARFLPSVDAMRNSAQNRGPCTFCVEEPPEVVEQCSKVVDTLSYSTGVRNHALPCFVQASAVLHVSLILDWLWVLIQV